MLTALAIGTDLRAALYAHARAAFPSECCGYLTGPPERYEQDYEGYEDEVRGLVTSTIHHQPFSWFSASRALATSLTSSLVIS